MTKEVQRYKCERCSRSFHTEEEAITHENQSKCLDIVSADGGHMIFGWGCGAIVCRKLCSECGRTNFIQIEVKPEIISFSTGTMASLPKNRPRLSYSEFTEFAEGAKKRFNVMADQVLEKAMEWNKRTSRRALMSKPYENNDEFDCMMICPVCRGTGRDAGDYLISGGKIFRVCPYCKGLGKVSKRLVL